MSKFNTLVIDDDSTSRIIMKRILSMLDCNINEAETGESALQMIHSNFYDAIVLDRVLPDMDGFDICKVIRTEKKLTNAKIVIVSGNDKQNVDKELYDLYFVKPIDIHDFQKSFQKLFNI